MTPTQSLEKRLELHNMFSIPTGATPTKQPLCVATQTSLQECTSAGETSPTATTAAGGERSCDKSHDSSESDEIIFSTPPQTPVDDDRVLVSRSLYCVYVYHQQNAASELVIVRSFLIPVAWPLLRS